VKTDSPSRVTSAVFVDFDETMRNQAGDFQADGVRSDVTAAKVGIQQQCTLEKGGSRSAKHSVGQAATVSALTRPPQPFGRKLEKTPPLCAQTICMVVAWHWPPAKPRPADVLQPPTTKAESCTVPKRRSALCWSFMTSCHSPTSSCACFSFFHKALGAADRWLARQHNAHVWRQYGRRAAPSRSSARGRVWQRFRQASGVRSRPA